MQVLRTSAKFISHFFHFKSAFNYVNIAALKDLSDIKYEYQQFPSRGADTKVVLVIFHRYSPHGMFKIAFLSQC